MDGEVNFNYSSAMKPLLPVLLAVAAVSLAGQQPAYDLVIRNGRILDGTGSPWYRGEIGVRGDTVARIAFRIEGVAARTIDARGQVVAPGFIDIHSHARDGIFDVPTAENYLRQGVTSIIEGPDGSSPIPIKPFLDKVAATRVTVNFGTFIGQGSVRDEVIGPINRKATPDEVEKMRGLVRAGMADGAFGLSTGLFYVPGNFTPTAEVTELARVAGAMGGIHISHMREETVKVADSVRETIEIGEKGGLPTQVTHHKVIGKANWGRSTETLRLIDDARARGVDATLDQYPYTASATAIGSALVPTWAREGGAEATMNRLKDAGSRADILAETIRLLAEERGGGDPQNVQLSRCPWDPSLDGKRLGDVTKGRGLEPTLRNAAETVLWIVENGGCGGIYHAIDEQDLQRIMRHPATMIASDGGIPVFGQAAPHPRNYGTFARVLGRYVRELKVITLEEAVRKMTSFPAQRLGLADRGVLKEGVKADIAVFDPASVTDRATFERPHQYSEGVSVVVVNGTIVFENGAVTAARPGRILYGPGKHE
jgi:dihydroorotase/N-acyl-D-amino-acid deacylase